MTPAYATATIRHEHWTITSRTDPRQRAKHDFRNTLQALVLAAAGGDIGVCPRPAGRPRGPLRGSSGYGKEVDRNERDWNREAK
jgi:hypothetical protein